MQVNALWRKMQLPFRTLPVIRITLLDLKNLSASPMAGLQRLAEVTTEARITLEYNMMQ